MSPLSAEEPHASRSPRTRSRAVSRRSCRALLVHSAVVFGIAVPAQAATLRVPLDFGTIHEGLAAAAPDDTVLVAPGTYTDAVDGSFAFDPTRYCGRVEPRVTLRSEAGPGNTRIHAPQSEVFQTFALVAAAGGYAFQRQGRDEPWARIEGFTISADSGTTGGCAFVSTWVRITDCVFEGLTSAPRFEGDSTEGAAIRSINTDLQVYGTVFRDCSAAAGGAVRSRKDGASIHLLFQDCRFENCSGRAVELLGQSDGDFGAEFSGCEFLGNSGGAVLMTSGGFALRNCRVEGTTGAGAVRFANCRGAWIEDCTFVGNDSPDHAVVQVTGVAQDVEDGSKTIRTSVFRSNFGKTGCIDWSVVGGSVLRNLFIDNSGEVASAGSFSSSRLLEVAGNLFVENGPGELAAISSPERVASSCNVTWQNEGTLPAVAGYIEVDPQLCDPQAGVPTLAASSPCFAANRLGSCGDVGPLGTGCPHLGTTTVSVESAPPGRAVRIDGESHWTPTFATRLPGSVVSLGSESIQAGAAGERFVWESWSDAGEIVHDIEVAESPSLSTAAFSREFLLRTTSEGGGTASPVESWLQEGTSAVVTATPDVHRQFSLWTGSGPGSYTGSSNPAVVTMDGPVTEHATFSVASYPVTISTGAGGTASPPSGTFPAQSTLEIRATPGPAHGFATWVGSGDGSYSGPNPVATITVDGPITQLAAFSPIAAGFDFALSASETDPSVTVGQPANGWREIYFWVTCVDRGLAAFEAEVETDLVVEGFVPRNGVLDAGSGRRLLLAIPDCPSGEGVNFLLGSWNVFDSGGEICLVAAAESGNLAAVDCTLPDPLLWADPVVTGFNSLGSPPCVNGERGCTLAAADPVRLEWSSGEESATAVGVVETDVASPVPNPFDAGTTLRFSTERAGPVRVDIFDVHGRLVRRLLDRNLDAGQHEFRWDGRDERQVSVAPGVLFARFDLSGDVRIKKLVRIAGTR